MSFIVPIIIALFVLTVFGPWALIFVLPVVISYLTFGPRFSSSSRRTGAGFGQFGPNFSRNQPVKISEVGFSTFFQVAGYISKSDGRISDQEIQQATQFMDRLSLSIEERQVAITCFNEGKSQNFDIQRCLHKLRASTGMQRLAGELLFEAMVHVAVLDGLTNPKVTILLGYGSALGIDRVTAQAFLNSHQHRYRREFDQEQQDFHRQDTSQQSRELNDAYAVLGVSASDADAQIKKIYKRKIAETHPDKFAGKDIPKFLIEAANERASEINHAWDVVKKSRGIN